ncbi:MAG: hypothetical protein ACKOAB_04075 [Polynucleobacter victoriensis]
MSQEVCTLLVEKLVNSEELGEMAQTIQTGLESGQGIWYFLLDNPMAFGMLIGGGLATWVRRWFYKETLIRR